MRVKHDAVAIIRTSGGDRDVDANTADALGDRNA